MWPGLSENLKNKKLVSADIIRKKKKKWLELDFERSSCLDPSERSGRARGITRVIETYVLVSLAVQ